MMWYRTKLRNAADARHREHLLTAALQRPLAANSASHLSSARACLRRGAIEVARESRRAMPTASRLGGPAARSNDASFRIVRAPVREIRQMRRQPAERHRFLVRLPAELLVRQPLEQPPRRAHLVIEFGQQRVLSAMRASVVSFYLACSGAARRAARRRRRHAPRHRRCRDLPGRSTIAGLSRRSASSATAGACRTSRRQTQHDLFFAQGFVQAQDRLFQMDLWRRSVQGRLAEVLGRTSSIATR